MIGSRYYRGCRLRLGLSDSLPPDMRNGIREITGIFTALENRGRGEASQLVKNVCAEADRLGFVLMLIPEPMKDSGLDQSGLVAFYARHGFEKTQDNPILMARRVGG